MDSSETSLIEHHQSPDPVLNSEEIPDHFICCVCLDLLYKPIVLHCGHISCFWCVHKSMSSRYESHCPICRNPYSHFPGICQMLHFLLLKLYPITYKKREDQILEEEKRVGRFSPEFNCHACESQADGELNYLGSPAHSSASSECPSTNKEKFSKPAGELESHYNGTNRTKENSAGDLNKIKPVAGEEKDQLSVADLPCTACKQLLFRPVVLNCGHGSNEAAKQDFTPVLLPSRDHLPFLVESSSYTHIGAGCDACGKHPIVGDRYKCKDCTEKMGFDLCRDCYNTRPKLPGRFNQRHTPEHKFELIKRNSEG
ncbi:hypothetical protein REPUB_Repub17cG0062200 [Reevesia pubescens]